MTTQELNSRLKALAEAHRGTAHLISRLFKLSAHPGSGHLNPHDADVRIELSAEIHQSLKEQEEDFELLKQEAEDLTASGSWSTNARRRDTEKDSQRVAFISQVERLGEDLRLARTQFRKAQVQAKRSAEAAKRRERELLFAGAQEGSGTISLGRRKGQEKLSQDELIENAKNDVTAGLRRVHQLLSSEVEKSQFARDTLDQSSAALASLNETYNTLENLLSSSRSLVSSLIYSQKSDTWYLETTFYILIATISWLVFRRLIYGPGWWLLYLPTKLMFRSITTVLNISISAFTALVGIIGGSAQSSDLSQASERISRSLIVKPSAKSGFPRFGEDMPAMSIPAGGGGTGAKTPPSGQDTQDTRDGESLLNKIGKMVEETEEENQDPSRRPEEGHHTDESTVLRERNEEEPPNPKKRMFEEPPASENQGERVRDEL